jgi:hypothetical protein
MSMRPLHPCRYSLCRNLIERGVYCPEHAHFGVQPDLRPYPEDRGYGPAWRIIRARVLSAAGIPSSEWHLYAVDHRPAYNPAIEPDHNRYALVPMLRGEHSRKTCIEDHGWGHGRGRIKSLEPSAVHHMRTTSRVQSKINPGVLA